MGLSPGVPMGTQLAKKKVQELFQAEFTDVTPPNKSITLRVVNKFRTEYSILNKLEKNSTNATEGGRNPRKWTCNALCRDVREDHFQQFL